MDDYAVCRYHPENVGIGVCMRCRYVICSACCTRLDGVNHCHDCLKKMAQRKAVPDRPPQSQAPVAVLVLSLTWLAFFGMLVLARGKLTP
jgi:hypothetical protein